MTSGEAFQNPDNGSNDEYTRLMGDVFSPEEQAELDAEFRVVDNDIEENQKQELLVIQKEVEVIVHLHKKVEDMGTLQLMVTSLMTEGGLENPNCEDLYVALSGMANENSDCNKVSPYAEPIKRMQFLVRMVQQLAGTTSRPMFQSKGDLALGIVNTDMLSDNEKAAFAEAGDIFMPSDQ